MAYTFKFDGIEVVAGSSAEALALIDKMRFHTGGICDGSQLPMGMVGESVLPRSKVPIDMVLHCPACGLQHIDAPEKSTDGLPGATWDNPPHRSHLCHGCDFIWRPADVPTNGVKAVKTHGKADHPVVERVTIDPVTTFIETTSPGEALALAKEGLNEVTKVVRPSYGLDQGEGPAYACPTCRRAYDKLLRDSDLQLFKFYSVDNIYSLVDTMEKQIQRLQGKVAKLEPPFDFAPNNPRQG